MATRKAPPRPGKPSRGGSTGVARARRMQFLEHFLTPGPTYRNGTQSALAIGISASNAAAWASKTLKDPKIKQELAMREREIVTAAQDRTQLTVDKLLKNLAQGVLVDPAKLYKDDGTMKMPHELDEDTRMAVSGIQMTLGKDGKPTSVEYKLGNRDTARAQALQHLGLIKPEAPPPAPPAEVNVTVHMKVAGMAPLRETFKKKLAGTK